MILLIIQTLLYIGTHSYWLLIPIIRNKWKWKFQRVQIASTYNVTHYINSSQCHYQCVLFFFLLVFGFCFSLYRLSAVCVCVLTTRTEKIDTVFSYFETLVEKTNQVLNDKIRGWHFWLNAAQGRIKTKRTRNGCMASNQNRIEMELLSVLSGKKVDGKPCKMYVQTHKKTTKNEVFKRNCF